MSTLPTSEIIQEMRSIRDLIRWAVTQFNQFHLIYGHGTDNSWDEAVNLVLTSLYLPPDVDISVLDARLTTQEKVLIVDRVKKRITERIPVAYLVKEAWFGGLNFYVDERALIPRSPIAELLEDRLSPWVEAESVQNILDLCTGSGCIGILAALSFPQAQVTALDNSKEALEVAKINVERFELTERVELIQSDLFDQISGKKFDIIVSNPPYVSQTEYDALAREYSHEPKVALLCETDGLNIVRQILVQARHYLHPHGVLIVEVGNSQALLEKAFVDVPFTWLQFERGGEGVFLLTAQELSEFSHLLNKKE